MSVPGITLWTNSFKMPLRLTECPFDQRSFKRQFADIQEKTHRFIEITPGALYILSCIAGRRMPEPVRWVLFDSLQDILNGKLRNLHPERQDLLAPTFGELLGVILLALRLGGTVEVIRLLEGGPGKMPDFLLLQDTPIGTIAHILECKGRVEDVHNINNLRGIFDLCQEQRDFRAEAREQINGIGCSLKLGARTMIRQKGSFGFSQLASTQNLVVSSIPDGRIMTYCTHSKFATRPQCRSVNCITCMTNTLNSSQANVISSLYRKEVAKNSTLDQALVAFLSNYQAAQRAAWSENATLFELSLNNMVYLIFEDDFRDEMIPSTIFMLITLLDVAKSEGFTGFDIDTQAIGVRVPEELRLILEERYREFLQVRQHLRRQSEPVSISNLQNSDDWEQRSTDHERVSEESGGETWYNSDLLVAQMINFIFREIDMPTRATISWSDIYGSIESEKYSAVVRLASTNKTALEHYLGGLIARLRGGKVLEEQE